MTALLGIACLLFIVGMLLYLGWTYLEDEVLPDRGVFK